MKFDLYISRCVEGLKIKVKSDDYQQISKYSKFDRDMLFSYKELNFNMLRNFKGESEIIIKNVFTDSEIKQYIIDFTKKLESMT